jgi:hypothetical protein
MIWEGRSMLEYFGLKAASLILRQTFKASLQMFRALTFCLTFGLDSNEKSAVL